MQKFLRGQVWFYNEPNMRTHKTEADNSVQRGSRPVIVVSNNMGNKKGPIITVVPCTTQGKVDLPTHFNFMLDATANTVLCEQIFTVGKADLVTYRGTLEEHEISMLNRCLAAALLLNEPQIITAPQTQNEKIADIVSTKLESASKKVLIKTEDDSEATQRTKRVYIKRTKEEKQEIIEAYCATPTIEELEELAKRYKFSNAKMLIQSVDRWMSNDKI